MKIVSNIAGFFMDLIMKRHWRKVESGKISPAQYDDLLKTRTFQFLNRVYMKYQAW